MPSNYTSNYKLNQWAKTDKVLMDDFNADNAKLDAALAAKADQSSLTSLQTTVSKKADQSALDALSKTVSGHTTALDGKGNCRIWTTSYTGTGTYGPSNPNKLTFPAKPAVVFVGDCSAGANLLIAINGQTNSYPHTNSFFQTTVSWSGNTMSWYTSGGALGQLNAEGAKYVVAALIEL